MAEGAELIAKLQASQVQQTLANQTNGISLHFSSDFGRTVENLANYFYHVEKRVNLAPFEQQIYEIIGDVDLEYALKYMTTFLLKFVKKEVVKQNVLIFLSRRLKLMATLSNMMRKAIVSI